MPTFVCSLNLTDQGIRSVKDAPKRIKASRELAKKLGVDIKQVYLTSGENDFLLTVESASGDNVAKWAHGRRAWKRAYPHGSSLARVRI